MKKILEEIRNLKYGVNNLNIRNHEENLENIVKNIGYSYKIHPNGKQNPPDIRIFLDEEKNKFIDIECKSCKKYYKPMWNSTYPKSDTIYIYNNKKDNKTLLFNGDEIVTEKVLNILEEYKKLNKELHKTINDKLENLSKEENPYNMKVYARNMFVQTNNLSLNKSNEYFENILKKYKLE